MSNGALPEKHGEKYFLLMGISYSINQYKKSCRKKQNKLIHHLCLQLFYYSIFYYSTYSTYSIVPCVRLPTRRYVGLLPGFLYIQRHPRLQCGCQVFCWRTPAHRRFRRS
jgi:hypothetical protein